MLQLLSRLHRDQGIRGRRMMGGSAGLGARFFSLAAVIAVLSACLPPLGLIGFPAVLLLVFVAALCLATVVLTPVVYTLY